MKNKYLFVVLFCAIINAQESPKDSTQKRNDNVVEPIKFYGIPDIDEQKDSLDVLGIKYGEVTKELNQSYSEKLYEQILNNRSGENGLNEPVQRYLVGTGKKSISKHPDGKYLVGDAMGYSLYKDLATQDGLSEHLYARVVSVTHPATLDKVIIVLYDLNFPSLLIRENVIKRIHEGIDPNFNDANLLLYATHNHNAPGGLSCDIGWEAANAGFSPENVESIGLYTFEAIKEAFSNEKMMNIGYNTYTVPEESALSFSRNSWAGYNANPEIIKAGKTIENFNSAFKQGDRKMEVISFVRNGQLHSIINFFATHPIIINPKGSYINEHGDKVETNIMSPDSRGFASLILEKELPKGGVVLYPQRGAADLDQVSYIGSNLDYFAKDKPEFLKYFVNRTVSTYFSENKKDPNNLADMVELANNQATKGYVNTDYNKSAMYSHLLNYETIRAIQNGPQEFISGTFDSELVYVDMPSQELPTDRGNYAETLHPLDFYEETEVKIPIYDLIKQFGSTVDEFIFAWIPEPLRPASVVDFIMENTVKEMVRIFSKGSKVVRTGEPTVGTIAIAADIGLLTENPALYNLFKNVMLKIPEEIMYNVAFFSGNKKFQHNLISHGVKDKIFWGGAKGYRKLSALINAENQTLSAAGYDLVGKAHDILGQHFAFAKDGFYKNAPNLYPRKVAAQITRFGDIMLLSGAGEFSNVLARRIENTVNYVMKGKIKRSIFVDYSNHYTGYWHTPEEYQTQYDFISEKDAAIGWYGAPHFRRRGVSQQLGFNLYGKWQGPVMQYNFEKLAYAMLNKKGNMTREDILKNNFVASPVIDLHENYQQWYDDMSAQKRIKDLQDGEYFDSPDAVQRTIQLLKPFLTKLPAGLVQEMVVGGSNAVLDGVMNIVNFLIPKI